MRLVGARREYHHMQPIFDQTERLKSAFTVVPSKIFDYESADPLEPGRQIERDTALAQVFSLLSESKLTSIFYRIYVYTYIR